MRTKLTSYVRKQKLNAGFSLMEGLIGVVVMGTVFISLYTGMAKGFQAIRMSRENTRATQILLEKFETLRLYNWEQIITPGFLAPKFTAQFFPNKTGDTSAGTGVTYDGTVTIEPVSFMDQYGSDMRVVRIDLRWQSEGIAYSRTFRSFVARYGIQHYVY